MVHELNEGHIAPYTDIEFQLKNTKHTLLWNPNTNHYNRFIFHKKLFQLLTVSEYEMVWNANAYNIFKRIQHIKD